MVVHILFLILLLLPTNVSKYLVVCQGRRKEGTEQTWKQSQPGTGRTWCALPTHLPGGAWRQKTPRQALKTNSRALVPRCCSQFGNCPIACPIVTPTPDNLPPPDLVYHPTFPSFQT